VNTNFQVVDLFIDRAYYKPGEAVKVTSKIENKMSNTQQVKITLSIRYLLNEIHSETQTINLKNGFTIVEFNYQPPTETPKGYGVEVKVEDEHGNVLTTDSTAFDVLNNWTQNPRYGFLTDFYPERNDVESTMSTLNRYHINGLQFYDWMYRHEQFLTNQDPYYDLWSPKPKSIKTVNALIDGAHKYNIAAMPYTAVYGASREYALQHPEMVLFKASGEMYDFGGDKMMIMDPRPGSPWTDHLMEQFKEILGQTRFDGIHIDQYGDPKVGYTKDHERYDLTPTLADFVNKTKTLTNIYSQKDAVVFNLVNNWPVEAIAPTNEDFVYIEVWPPHNWFADLHTLIVMSQKLGGGKPVVLACYIDPAFENTAILNDAIIFASGGGHIEIGENNGMLSEAYFPNYRVISDYLAMTLQDYYDFSVRYQNVTGPTTQDATTNYKDKISIPNISTSVSSLNDVVWPFVRESEITTAINLVNLLDIEQNEWTAEVPNKPLALHNFQMSVNVGSRKVANVWFATPDHPQADQHLTFTLESGTLRIEVPSLDFWSMVVIEWANN
jgi:dextranase